MFDKYINTIIYANMLPFILLCVFFILVCYNPVFNKRQSTLFKITTLITIFMIVNISVDYISSLIPTYEVSIIRTITTFIKFSISPIIPLLLYKISNPKNNSNWIYTLLLLNIILCAISIPTGIIFSVNEFNNYSRGFLFFVPFAVTIIYMLILIVSSQQSYLRSQISERLLLFFSILLLVMGMTLEIISRFQFFVWTSVAVSLPLYYLLLNINHAILDPLTACFNRLKYSKDIDKINLKHNCVIASIDLNDFKNVNDQYGHEVGDQFLIKLVQILNRHITSHGSIYRIGGDEFIIIAKKNEEKEKINQYLINAKKELHLNKIDFSYGIDIYNHNSNISDFLVHIDSLMYENKKRDKQEKSSLL